MVEKQKDGVKQAKRKERGEQGRGEAECVRTESKLTLWVVEGRISPKKWNWTGTVEQ